ncbi:cadherin-23, partial [Biomphalaria glabrata]
FLSIIIEDENDNGPKFIGGDHFIAKIPENMPKDTELKLEDVLYLTAVDSDA